MATYETHDAVANGVAVGVLDASDFNKMLSKPIFQIGWFLFYVFCTFYLFCGIAIVCDDFYAEAIDEVVEVLKRCLRTSPSRPSWRSGRRRPSSSR